MAGVHAILTSVIVLLSIRRGEGGLRPTEVIMIALAGAGVIGWIVADEPKPGTLHSKAGEGSDGYHLIVLGANRRAIG